MLKRLFLLVLCLNQATNAVNVKVCQNAWKACYEDIDCALDYYLFGRGCPHIVVTKLDKYVTAAELIKPVVNCSARCISAIYQLNNTIIGEELYNCDTQLDGDWLTIKSRVSKCLNPNFKRRIGCTEARKKCFQDNRCRLLQDNFLGNCTDLISGVKCERRCMKAQKRLFAHEVGRHMNDCECDGLMEPFCRGLQAHAAHLRCSPGMDGSGTRVFDYNEEVSTLDSLMIHGLVTEQPNNRACLLNFGPCLFLPLWTALVTLFISSLLLI